MLAAKGLPFQIRQGAQLHRDDGFRLVGRELVRIGGPLFLLEVAEAALAESPGDQFGGYLDRLQINFRFGPAGRVADCGNDQIDLALGD